MMPDACVVHLVDAADLSDRRVMVVPAEVYLDGHLMRTPGTHNVEADMSFLGDGLHYNGVQVDSDGGAPVVAALANAEDVEYDPTPGVWLLRWGGVDLLAPERDHVADTGLETRDGSRVVLVRFFASAIHIVGAEHAPRQTARVA